MRMGKITRGISENGGVVVAVINSTDVVSRAEEIHKTSAVVTAALGRLLSGASLMGCSLKGDKESLTLTVRGDGPIGVMTVVSDSEGNVRGYAQNPVVELPLNNLGKLDVGRAVGKGTLSVVKDFGVGEPYVGQIELQTGEIAEDLTAYYAISEQIPTVCALGVLVNPDLSVRQAGGFLLQLLPGATEEEINLIEENLKNLKSITQMMEDGLTSEDIIHLLLKGFHPNLLDEFEVEYRCNCSKERVEKALISLGKEELLSLSKEQETTDVDCHFCKKAYSFASKDLENLSNSV